MSVGEAVIGRVEVPPLVELRLLGLVEHHRVHGALVGQVEIQELERDRDLAHGAVRAQRDLSLVEAGRPAAARVDLDPDGLGRAARDGEREAAAPGARVLRHELDRLPARGLLRGRGAARLPHPRRVRLGRHVHGADGVEADRPAGRERGIARGRGIADALVRAAPSQLRERGGEGRDAGGVGLHDHLEGQDFVARAEEANRAAVPRGVLRGEGRRGGVGRDLLAVADRPHRRDAGAGRDGGAEDDESRHEESLHGPTSRGEFCLERRRLTAPPPRPPRRTPARAGPARRRGRPRSPA